MCCARDCGGCCARDCGGCCARLWRVLRMRTHDCGGSVYAHTHARLRVERYKLFAWSAVWCSASSKAGGFNTSFAAKCDACLDVTVCHGSLQTNQKVIHFLSHVHVHVHKHHTARTQTPRHVHYTYINTTARTQTPRHARAQTPRYVHKHKHYGTYTNTTAHKQRHAQW